MSVDQGCFIVHVLRFAGHTDARNDGKRETDGDSTSAGWEYRSGGQQFTNIGKPPPTPMCSASSNLLPTPAIA